MFIEFFFTFFVSGNEERVCVVRAFESSLLF